MSTPIRPQLLADAVVASYIHEISTRHRPAESTAPQPGPSQSSRTELLQVALDGVGAPDLGVIRISARVANRPTLTEQIPAAVELDLQCA